MGPGIVVLWLIVPLIIVIAIVWAMIAERKRQKAIEQAAAALGLAYSAKLADADLAEFNGFSLARLGHGRAATNAITADSGELRMVIFDYTYTTGSGKNKSTYRQSVVLCSSPSLQLPEFSLSPESFFHRIADFLGYQDIDFEEDEPFSRQFLLKGPDEPAIRQLFNQQRRTAFMKWAQVSIEGRGNTFIFYQSRKRRGVEQLRELMEEGFAVYAKLGSEQPASML